MKNKNFSVFTVEEAISNSKQNATVARAFKAAKNLEDNLLVTTKNLCTKASPPLSVEMLYKNATHADLQPFRCFVKNKLLWGNQKTIALLKKKMGLA